MQYFSVSDSHEQPGFVASQQQMFILKWLIANRNSACFANCAIVFQKAIAGVQPVTDAGHLNVIIEVAYSITILLVFEGQY
jgi:hypothetical protein